MEAYEITAKMNLKNTIAETKEFAKAMTEFADALEKIEKKYAEDISHETVTEFADRCKECGARYGRLFKKSEWEHDHEILKAHSDGANDMLDKIRDRVELERIGYPPSEGYYKAITKVLQIIDEYSEGGDPDERKTES